MVRLARQKSHLSGQDSPECVIAPSDALVFLLDAWNIQQRVQLDAEKRWNVYANYKRQEKHVQGNLRGEIRLYFCAKFLKILKGTAASIKRQ